MKLKFLGSMQRTSTENEKLISIEEVPNQVSKIRRYSQSRSEAQMRERPPQWAGCGDSIIVDWLNEDKHTMRTFVLSDGISKVGTVGGIILEESMT